MTNLHNLLAWMREQPFEKIVGGEPGLLRMVEEAVVDAHRRWHQREHRPWTEPVAYRWLRYEDPDPIGRLEDGLRRLAAEGVEPDPARVRQAFVAAERLPGGEMIFGRRPGP